MCTVLCPPMLFMAISTTLSGMCISALFLLGLGGLGGRLGVRFGGSNRDNLGGHLGGQNGSKMDASQGG